MKPKLSIIGVGKVGCTLARLYHEAGYNITTIYNRSIEPAKILAYQVDASIATSPEQVVAQSDLIFITVSDDAIEEVTNQILTANWQGKAVVHTSGAKSAQVLQVLADRGAMVGSFHPAYPFANVETALQGLSGATVAIEATDTQLQEWLLALVNVVDGKPLMIPEGKKALYHAGLVMASNYTVTLYATAQMWLESLSDDTEAISNALNVLIQATVDNIKEQGIPDALTGPLVRADIGTLQSHQQALDDLTHQQAYRILAELTLPMLHQRGIDTHTIERLLQDNTHETLDHTQHSKDEN